MGKIVTLTVRTTIPEIEILNELEEKLCDEDDTWRNFFIKQGVNNLPLGKYQIQRIKTPRTPVLLTGKVKDVTNQFAKSMDLYIVNVVKIRAQKHSTLVTMNKKNQPSTSKKKLIKKSNDQTPRRKIERPLKISRFLIAEHSEELSVSEESSLSEVEELPQSKPSPSTYGYSPPHKFVDGDNIKSKILRRVTDNIDNEQLIGIKHEISRNMDTHRYIEWTGMSNQAASLLNVLFQDYKHGPKKIIKPAFLERFEKTVLNGQLLLVRSEIQANLDSPCGTFSKWAYISPRAANFFIGIFGATLG